MNATCPTPSRRTLIGGLAIAGSLLAVKEVAAAPPAAAASTIPQKVVEFALGNVIMQSFARDPHTGDWYVMVPVGSPSVDTLVYHCSPTGAVIDSMRMVGAGHGTQMGLFNESNAVVLFAYWKSVDTQYRVTYRPGTMQYDDPNVRPMPIVDPLNHFFSIDQETDRITIFGPLTTIPNVTQKITFVLRKLSEFLCGVGEPIVTKTITLNTPTQAFQGMTSNNGRLYVTVGGLPGNGDPAIMNWPWHSADGTPPDSFDAYQTGFGYPLANFGDYWEPEGVCIVGGRVMFGINSKNSSGSHTNTVYRLP